jgi:deoxyribonuclease V
MHRAASRSGKMMIAFVDVQYGADHATAGCVLAAGWTDPAPAAERVASAAIEAEYLPGELYRRELPPILAVLDGIGPLELVVVDGYVWLGPDRPGLGVHLHRALGGVTPVVGVAKSRFAGAAAIPVVRGASARPLWVTAVGAEAEAAAAQVASMHGEHRLPTLLLRADHLARGLP